MRSHYLLLLLAGCAASDPCAGQSGQCVSVQVVGNAKMLDQLAFTIDGSARRAVTPASPKSFSLPVGEATALGSGDGFEGVERAQRPPGRMQEDHSLDQVSDPV